MGLIAIILALTPKKKALFMKNYISLLLGFSFICTHAGDKPVDVTLKYYKTDIAAYSDKPSNTVTLSVTIGMQWRYIQDRLRKELGYDGELRHGSLKMDQWRPTAEVTEKDLGEIEMYSFWPPLPDDPY